MGQIAVGENGQTLSATGVGSCLVVTLFDPEHGRGAMAHAMLPRGEREGPPGRCVDSAVRAMVESLERLGSRRASLECKLAGGATMFTGENVDTEIGAANIRAGREAARRHGLALVNESTGGTMGRSVEFSCASGVVTVSIKF